MKWIDSVNDNDGDLPACYLPHHCVLKPSNETTKLRVVFDASCESSTGVSLNDALMVGSTAQQDLFSIILRFRTLAFVFSADIVKMYRQILINPKQTKLQRIFWRDHAGLILRIGELLTVTYGTAAAAHLAIKTLEYLAETYTKQFPVGAEHIMRDFYVDDMLSGADTLEEALKIKSEVVEILSRGAFQLSKWSSNHVALLGEDQNKHNADVQIDRESTSRVLGIVWNPSTDTFRFAIEQPANTNKITKRIILSEIAKLFDPLGLLGPVIILPKILLQEIWQLKLQWDESIPLDLHTRWSAFKEQLTALNELRIPRFIKERGEHSRFQIHGFCDASQRAYGACLYIRRQIGENEFRVDLWCSKTRVAPLKTISISRLELCAALLLAQLWDKARSSIEVGEAQSFLWSDATIALRWISSCSRKWSVFVANRVGEIQRLTRASDWRHVPSAQNPADLLSRGIYPHEIRSSALWWHGPEFLRESEAAWPRDNPYISESEMPEMRRTVAVAVAATANPFVELAHRCSSLNKLCRIMAYCLRFLKSHLHPHREAGTRVSHEEICTALDCLCKNVQRDAFSSEIHQLEEGVSLTSSSSLTSLAPFLDERGLIRVGGRLGNSELSYGARHLILLPKNHRLTYLIIEREHRRNLHAGLQGIIAAVRQSFWPLSVRSVTRRIIRQCVACFRCRPVTSEAKMGVLPPPRVTPSRPFSNCGVDYAGPLIVREGKRRNARNSKAYVCVFVCLATKAVHLEVVSDLTTEAFLAAFKRFISRRGSPSSMHSDNGTNFKGASRQLSELYEFYRSDKNQDKIKQFCCDLRISWQFIPPGAPHFGGLWEAAVKSAKYHLQRIAGDSHLTFEELQMTLCEIEAILNSRPLTPLSSDPNDLSYITPGHFLIGDVLNGFPCRDLTDINENRLVRWQRIEQLRQHFWSRWSREYLNQLQQRHKWATSKGEQLKVGQMVLIIQPGVPPLQWILGRVTETHPGSDGTARSATVATTKGSIVRPLARLAILPLENSSQ
ncbi:uncharacterized protein LOC143895318 [Temnothorax americanus]|uniref:uncharacterized protein LOC143895318 n=1 Tax=Temnothorax americanus TaxID=1964332 RepID=UPI004067C80D